MGCVDCWKSFDLELINQHSVIHYFKDPSLSNSSLRKSLDKDFSKVYPNFSPHSFNPKHTHFTPS